MDSSIRLRQINQTELTNFVLNLISSYATPAPTGSIIPSGLADLGSSTNQYSHLYAGQVVLPSGSGILFGNTPFNAYVSGGVGYLNVGGVFITSSGNSIFIQGPSGVAGPSGASGPIGPSGVGVTGITYDTNSSYLTFYLSNNTQKQFNFQGLSGDTGISVTGFFQSGNVIFPQFDHFKGTGAPITLPAGPAGPMGSIVLFYQSGDSSSSLRDLGKPVDFPSEVIINPYYDSSYFPPISLMRGMAYTFDVSGLNSHTITQQDYLILSGIFSGQAGIPTPGTQINYYVDQNNGTGYWRLAFFDANTPTGLYDSINNPSLFSETHNTEVYGSSLINNIYRTKTSFLTSFSAQNQYKYGFVVYSIGADTVSDEILNSPSTGYAFVVGDAYFSSGVGPVGPQGPSGSQGNIGPVGPIGPSGLQGNDGSSVVSYNQQQIGPNSYQVQFIFSDGSTGPWISLPSGGPSGANGAQGPVGSLVNLFSGAFSLNTIYAQNVIVTSGGSSYVYINSSPSSGNLPSNTSFWQLLAQKGDIGATGASGYADKYSAGFYVNSGTSISVNGVSVSGLAEKFTIGNTISFSYTGLNSLAFTPNQNVIVSSKDFANSFFYATVNSYSSFTNSGLFNLTITSGGTGIVNTTISGGNYLFYNYGNSTINLGANIVSGATGPQGPVGPQGPAGAPSALRNLSFSGGAGSSFILDPSQADVFNIMITGNGSQTFGGPSVQIDISGKYFQTGQSLIIKVRNSGIPDGNGEPPLFYFSGVNTSSIKWPNGVYTRPDDGQAYIYTLLRFPNEFGQFSAYGTYSNPYF